MLNNHHGCFYTTSERLDLERELKESLNPADLTVFLSKHFPSSPATIADSDEPETARFAAPNAEEEEGRKRKRKRKRRI
jgi:hypothetical protein